MSDSEPVDFIIGNESAMHRALTETLPVPREAILTARDALRTARHSAAVTRALIDEAAFSAEPAGRLPGGLRLPPPDRIVGEAIGTAQDLARSFLPGWAGHGGAPWQDLVACALRPAPSLAYPFAAAAYSALSRFFRTSGRARALIAEYRLYTAYAAAIEYRSEKRERAFAERPLSGKRAGHAADPAEKRHDPEADGGRDAAIGFIARLVAQLHRSEAIVDIRCPRGAGTAISKDQWTAEALFALGLFMAASLGNAETDREGQFEAASDLSRALGHEVSAAIGDDAAVEALLRRYRQHL